MRTSGIAFLSAALLALAVAAPTSALAQAPPSPAQQSEQARAPAAAGLAHIPVTVAGAAPVWHRIPVTTAWSRWAAPVNAVNVTWSGDAPVDIGAVGGEHSRRRVGE